ncbi:MAG: hypothetical protein LKG90_08030 [Lachnospiraceae bacterium]|jgi:hypothetical protein|nr:hypothetical protein [Lachnospiraceae bacterium]MCH4028723.1 hypothetical protein [Lachnospiraceae bacterium]MCH4066574.1 hypothetical protein [Lachnospiraceae bacterium]MCH4112603.1 hypothetical protein [Lachnospiraceae bacterium]MCI1353791.1 hypothetical protein [Lachnospiraceae bacterium]
MNKNYGPDPYQNLANAIVAQAAQDYLSALKKLKKNPRNRMAMDEAMQLEKFFHSGWYGVLTGVDPDYLIRKLREKVAA